MQGEVTPYFLEEGGWRAMDTYQTLTLMLAFGMFILSLVSYIDRNNSKKK